MQSQQNVPVIRPTVEIRVSPASSTTLPEEKYLIDWWVPKATSILLVGRPKSGKTSLLYDAASSVLSGGEFFGGQKAKQGRVLIIQGEETQNLTWDRLGDRGIYPDNPLLDLWTDFLYPRDTEKFYKALSVSRYDLVIVDSLRRIVTGSGFYENQPVFVEEIRQFNQLCNSLGAAVIATHFLAKQSFDVSSDGASISAIAGHKQISEQFSAVWELVRYER